MTTMNRAGSTYITNAISVLVVVAIIALAIWGSITSHNHQITTIRQWASEQNCDISNIEQPMFQHGPFWFVDEDDTIYKVTLTDNEGNQQISWFRFGEFNHHEQLWEVK